MTQDNLKHARAQAIAQFHSITEMVATLRKARDGAAVRDNGYEDIEEAECAIQEDALSVQVRSGWYAPGDTDRGFKPTEYEILLCTGGPAVRIVGDLSEYGEPESARIEFQDWFTPWTAWRPSNSQNVEHVLLDYARCFYFGE